jgi:ribonuclease P protein component
MGSKRSITSRRDFERVLREGRRARRGVTTVVAAPAAPETLRLGLAVRARTGGAVARNRARRRLREAFWSAGPRPGHDVVIRSDERAASIAYDKLRSDLTAGLVEVGVAGEGGS